MPAATVLIVEDDLDLQDFLRDVLGDQGYSVTMAANGLEALAALSRGPRPNVILLDLMMPLMDGWQFLAEVRAHGPYPDVPVVVETASKEPVVGANAVVRKPFEVGELLEQVSRCCTVSRPPSAQPHG